MTYNVFGGTLSLTQSITAHKQGADVTDRPFDWVLPREGESGGSVGY